MSTSKRLLAIPVRVCSYELAFFVDLLTNVGGEIPCNRRMIQRDLEEDV